MELRSALVGTDISRKDEIETESLPQAATKMGIKKLKISRFTTGRGKGAEKPGKQKTFMPQKYE
jgi:hypothetical protein